MENPNAIVMCIQGERVWVEEVDIRHVMSFPFTDQQTVLLMRKGALSPTSSAKWTQKVLEESKGHVLT